MKTRTKIMMTMWMMGSLERTRMMRPLMTTPCRMIMQTMTTKSILCPNPPRELLRTLMKEKAPLMRRMTMVDLVSKMKMKKARDN